MHAQWNKFILKRNRISISFNCFFLGIASCVLAGGKITPGRRQSKKAPNNRRKLNRLQLSSKQMVNLRDTWLGTCFTFQIANNKGADQRTGLRFSCLQAKIITVSRVEAPVMLKPQPGYTLAEINLKETITHAARLAPVSNVIFVVKLIYSLR